MSSLSPKFIDSLHFDSSHLADLRKLGEFRGKQSLFSKKSQEALKVLKQHAIIESVESSNRLEQITAPYKANAKGRQIDSIFCRIEYYRVIGET